MSNHLRGGIPINLKPDKAVNIKIGTDYQKRRVVILFNCTLQHVDFDPKQAIDFAEAVKRKAELLL